MSHASFAIPRGTPAKERAVTPALLRTITVTHKSAYFHAEDTIPQRDLKTNDLLREKLNTELTMRAAKPLAHMTPALSTPAACNATAKTQARP